ncbi:MAG TPA: hypothetical protein VJS91_06220 [Nitrososphaeraceae archaeon]|nr:hypothetical protein [Nitrososphaeraceae archaeon]
MKYFITELCNICSCNVDDLTIFALNPKFRNNIAEILYGSILRTLFTVEDGLKRAFYFQGFSVQTVATLTSSDCFPDTPIFHNIQTSPSLNYPNLPLVIDYLDKGTKLYPIELLELVDAD